MKNTTSNMTRRIFLKNTAVLGAAQIVNPFTARYLYANNHSYKDSRIPANSEQGEILYNGIRLPVEWPPKDLDPLSTDPMPVPYLSSPPAVIPIDTGRQLFVDDFLIQKTNLKRNFHRPEKYAGNPVFRAETEEALKRRNTVYTGHGGCFYDPGDKLFKLFYVDGWRGPLAMAVSKDMVNWNRPSLLPGKDNILIPRSVDDNCVWLDFETENTNERFKYHECGRSKGHFLFTSADGRKGLTDWSEGHFVGRASDYCSFFYNPFRKVWVFSIKRDHRSRGRCRYYFENKNFINGTDWSDSVYWTNADHLDLPEPDGRYPGAGEPTQLYSLNAVAYESLLIGMHYIHRGPDNKICEEGGFPKITDLEVGFSRDGFYWDRPDRNRFIVGTRTEGSWDRAYLHSTSGVFVVLHDKLVFPYTGFSGKDASGKGNMYAGGAIGLALLRRDGFASMDALRGKGYLITRPVKFNGNYLFVNVDCLKGELRVEILDERNRTIDSFSAKKCQKISADNTLQAVKWSGSENLSTLKGKNVRFRFHLTNGRLFSFWVSPDKNGASYGYLGAGGPAYNGVIDKTGSNI